MIQNFNISITKQLQYTTGVKVRDRHKDRDRERERERECVTH